MCSNRTLVHAERRRIRWTRSCSHARDKYAQRNSAGWCALYGVDMTESILPSHWYQLRNVPPTLIATAFQRENLFFYVYTTERSHFQPNQSSYFFLLTNVINLERFLYNCFSIRDAMQIRITYIHKNFNTRNPLTHSHRPDWALILIDFQTIVNCNIIYHTIHIRTNICMFECSTMLALGICGRYPT